MTRYTREELEKLKPMGLDLHYRMLSRCLGLLMQGAFTEEELKIFREQYEWVNEIRAARINAAKG